MQKFDAGIINRNFYLSSLEIQVNEEYDFSYAGISGYAEIIGCKIAFFRKNKNAFLDAFSFMEIEQEEFDFCNAVLENINFPIRFGDSLSKVYELFGKETSVNDYFENYDRYNYYMENYFISFSIGDKGVSGVEIIFNDEIISEISDFR